MTLSENLKKLREEEGITLRELETHTGLSNAFLSQLETGRVTNPSLKCLQALAEFYDLTLDEIVGP